VAIVVAKTQRIEMRTDPDSEALITQAARLMHQSVSAFVLAAATAEAQRVLARVDHVVMPADQFDALISSLDTSADAPALARAARRERRFTRG
jgi:uncharacterized protein (DUF1778 family)